LIEGIARPRTQITKLSTGLILTMEESWADFIANFGFTDEFLEMLLDLL
tara:strand:+ start:509 stop:655 length:147 start_codon:yes stop_codon:yes gene_type:complete